jgi:2',3'-cyclic-nucleotide 2'-phosphodiesterase (5'-nucleotidase family)
MQILDVSANGSVTQSVPVAVTILHTNDLHGTLSSEKLATLRPMRDKSDFYFDTGDAIKAGNLAIPLRPEPVWGRLTDLDCDASVLGNRESHILTGAFAAKIAGAQHPLLAANMRRRDGSHPVQESLILTRNGIRFGIFGVMVPMVTERMKTAPASAFLWDAPILVAERWAETLRPEVDCVIALTHICHRADRELADRGVVDIIFGGHSHTVLAEPEQIGRTAICQGGSHAKFYGHYQWDGRLTGRLIPWP